MDFFWHGWLLPSLNSNCFFCLKGSLNSKLVVLILKVMGADKIEQFCSITLANLANFYLKFVSKVLAGRLTIIGPTLICERGAHS
jgi:hypothetical protein